MTDLGARLGFPHPSPRPVEPRRADATLADATGDDMTARVAARVRRVWRGFVRLVDQAPFDLAWPPTHRGGRPATGVYDGASE